MKTPDEIKKGLECCKPVWKGDHWKSCDEKCPYSAEASFCKTVLNGDTRALIQQLEAQAPKWISFNEKTPLINTSVLCYGSYEGKPHIYIDYMLVNGTTVMDELYGPTHWMPLPEPLKEEDHAQTD